MCNINVILILMCNIIYNVIIIWKYDINDNNDIILLLLILMCKY